MKTYCNPLPIENIPEGRKNDFLLTRENPVGIPDYRSISDPSMVWHDGKWIMYPSYGLAYVSEDFVNWKHIDIGVEEVNYSPAIVQFKGKWYLTGHGRPQVYCADEPTGPFKPCGMLTDAKGRTLYAADGCYLADGDRLYFYWHDGTTAVGDNDVEYLTMTVAAELDPDEPWKLITEPVVLNVYNPDEEWQRTGEYNQNRRMGWIEGQWAFKIGSRYYLMYSACGTQYSGYANAIMYSDEGPLSGFKPQKNHTPLVTKRHGVVRGAGHGSIVKGPKDTLWMFYTCVFGFNYMFERRVAMDPIGIDENGELYCKEATDVPQYAPGVLEHPENGNGAGLLPLTFNTTVKATSHAEGREPIYAADENVITWWQPHKDDKQPCITYTLGKDTAYDVYSLRIIWRDIGMETTKGIMPGAFGYIAEYASDKNQTEWHTLVDAQDNTRDLSIDYREFEPVRAYAVRLRILNSPKGITPGLVSMTAFGVCSK